MSLLSLKQRLFKDSAFGWDGLTTFIFSNILLLLSFGIGFLFLLWQTTKTALQTKTQLSQENYQTVLVAGLCLINNTPSEAFKRRLNRAQSLLQKTGSDKNLSSTRKIILLGGMTGDNTISESRAGANYLISRGVSEAQVIVEEQSRHTLENIQHARTLLTSNPTASASNSQIAIISSRYHLYRILSLARGLNMDLQAVAAEEQFHWTVKSIFRLLKEAYYLHWYWSGKLWVKLTVNKKSRARIT